MFSINQITWKVAWLICAKSSQRGSDENKAQATKTILSAAGVFVILNVMGSVWRVNKKPLEVFTFTHTFTKKKAKSTKSNWIESKNCCRNKKQTEITFTLRKNCQCQCRCQTKMSSFKKSCNSTSNWFLDVWMDFWHC